MRANGDINRAYCVTLFHTAPFLPDYTELTRQTDENGTSPLSQARPPGSSGEREPWSHGQRIDSISWVGPANCFSRGLNLARDADHLPLHRRCKRSTVPRVVVVLCFGRGARLRCGCTVCWLDQAFVLDGDTHVFLLSWVSREMRVRSRRPDLSMAAEDEADSVQLSAPGYLDIGEWDSLLFGGLAAARQDRQIREPSWSNAN
ncbi:uncharacterized protein L969DRAFT_46006 [Mixia osmundae IAM 14324]|uniref:Uncharacterized protein n=1 Tax=Mixia osmundae (strain CBS 9802 / IAM 14324 / JCM 22182 / KY 12970) TaxID=764103 RepID=G7E685_MIXOS|nr:uncharacterized protein L969DRAFT_46006 [Mixia osmundae IAM 14324]KEI40502.1 hypothetical protein L969DRAFT_46006 [Mixia osmundae IAM 14324]GAA98345.1 hypothetical protein E5Q_05030 [Mixia osmundae IAM 14324]